METQSAGLGPKIFTYAMAILFVCTTLTIAAQKKSATLGGTSVFTQDKGKFTIQLDGKSVGHEEFELAQAGGGWTAHSTTDIAPPQAGSARISGTGSRATSPRGSACWWSSAAPTPGPSTSSRLT